MATTGAVDTVSVRIVSPESPFVTDQGHVTVSWGVPAVGAARHAREAGGQRAGFVLEQSREPGFAKAVVRYRGADTASFLSGLAGGDHYFRVRADREGAGWSEPLHVVVEYPGMGGVAVLMSVGAVCLVALVATIVIGHRRGVAGAGLAGGGAGGPGNG